MALIIGNRAVRTVALWALFLALALAVTGPMFAHPTWWGAHDWTQFYAYYGVPRQAVVEYREIPGWNPYYYGGNVQWGHPDDPTLSPVFVAILAAGEVIGPKIDVVLVLAGGMFCMWLLARFLGISAIGRLFAAGVWGLNGWHAFHLAVGHMDHLTFLVQPLAVLFYLKSFDDRRWTFAAGGVIALMLLSGGPYPFVFTSILLVVLGLIMCGRTNNGRPFTSAVLTLVLSAALAAVKLVSMIEFAALAQTVNADVTGTLPGVMWRGLFDRALPMTEPYGQTVYGTWEFAAFIGFVPVALFLVGAAVRIRQVWPWVAMAAIFLVTAFGSACPVNFFALFTAPPGLSGMHVPFRFIVHVILATAIVGAMGLDWLAETIAKITGRFAAVCAAALIAAAATGDLIWMHYDRPVALYSLPSRFLPPAKFGGVLPVESERPMTARDEIHFVPRTYQQSVEVYLAFLEKRRLSWGYDAVHLKNAAVLEGTDGYRGEAYLVDVAAARKAAESGAPLPKTGAGGATLKEWSLSRYAVSYEAADEAYLVLNQNYAPGWDAEGVAATPVNLRGLVAAHVGVGRGEVTFVYSPPSRVVGTLITLVTLAGGIVVVTRGFGRRRPAGSRRHGAKPPAVRR